MSRRIAFSGGKVIPCGKIGAQSAQIPSNDHCNKSSARARQTAQQPMEMTYAYRPHVLALDRRAVDIPSAKCLRKWLMKLPTGSDQKSNCTCPYSAAIDYEASFLHLY
jgi:hypothetical protein